MPSNDELNARMAEARAKILPTRTVQSADYAGGFMEAKRQALAHLAAVTRQRDELVEAVGKERTARQCLAAFLASVVTFIVEAGDGPMSAESVAKIRDNVNMTYDRCELARIQAEQPKGEWVEIAADGSNLPEYVEGAEWCIIQEAHDGSPVYGPVWTIASPPNWPTRPCPRKYHVARYYSIPHIGRRPDVPEYQPRKENDERP